MRPFNLSRMTRAGDTVMQGGLDTDVVILIMGPTGAGKSTFLRNVLQRLQRDWDLPTVGDDFESCTRNLAHYVVPLPQEFAKVPGQRLVLVDTPGFDDTAFSDTEILRRIGVWLASSYNSHMKVGGVVYMFPIFPNRMTRNDKSNLKVFQKLCGKDALAKVCMVKTKSSLCDDPQILEKREQQLESRFWKEMVDGGSTISTLHDDPTSAWNLLTDMLNKYCQIEQLDEIALGLQREVVEKARSLPRTQAGRELKVKLKGSQRSLNSWGFELLSKIHKKCIFRIRRFSRRSNDAPDVHMGGASAVFLFKKSKLL
ncbi:P-loop containing nucleoside triphosphate hydrolase protein [Coprinopsis sp. MPI-PUGE-AT-0042]|nr:P-loop containing nucleoside triphosphate hydrolase protein [Coprinopsis sp. MPI-PUGE-AT-0042]